MRKKLKNTKPNLLQKQKLLIIYSLFKDYKVNF